MGAQSVKAISNEMDRKTFIYHLLKDIEALEIMVKTDAFEKACNNSSQKVTLNMREGYDHSYYFISTFITIL